jgi:hypothetical protein
VIRRYACPRLWQAQAVAAIHNVVRPGGGGPYPCPCCGYLTLEERGGDEICPVCFWEDDGQYDHDADVVRGGPNYELSLSQARSNFQRIGAASERVSSFVRPPRTEEIP